MRRGLIIHSAMVALMLGAAPVSASTGPVVMDLLFEEAATPKNVCTKDGIFFAEGLDEGGMPHQDIWGLDSSSAPSAAQLCRVGQDMLEVPEYDNQLRLLTDYKLNPTSHQSVNIQIRDFTGRFNTHFTRWLGRSGRYLPMMRGILAEYGLPEDLAYLPLIESGYNPRAYSRSHAAGLWQFIESTGRNYGLKVNWWVDERRDPVKATHAAARYLSDLYAMFESWPLALAAYNGGEGRIMRAIKSSQTDDYWHIYKTSYIKSETKHYVPKFIAARLIAREPEKYGFEGIAYEPGLRYDEVTLTSPLTLDVAARCAETTVEAIKELNPELRRGATPPVDRYTLKVPHGAKEAFEAKLAALPPEERRSLKQYVVERGDTVYSISRRLGVSPSAVISYNKLSKGGRLIQPGQVLSIPVPYDEAYDAKLESRSKASMGGGLKGRVYTVRRGDTVSGIAKATGTSRSEIISANGLKPSGRILAGQKLILPN